MSSKIYIDSCIAIYLVEEHPVYAPAVESVLSANPDFEFFVSDLTVLECLVLPLRNENELLVGKFQGWFANTRVLGMRRAVFEEAARLRAEHSSLKTPDALHLATCINNGCDEFWTNDNRLNNLASTLVKNIIDG